MLKPIAILGAVSLLIASATLGLNVPGGASLKFLNSLPTVDREFKKEFRSEFLSRSNHLRNEFAVSGLAPDHEIEEFLSGYLSKETDPESIQLNTVFDALQKKYPGAQYLAANLVSAINRDELLTELSEWDELTHPEFKNVSTTVIGTDRKLIAMSVLSRRIPRFSLAAANNGGQRFFNVCPHGGSVHALELNRKTKTLILSCPDCDRAYDVIASDSSGTMRRANEFFTEFQLPGLSPKISPKKRVLSIWKTVADRCTYQHDHSEYDQSEVWKTSDETWFERQGDCEDTSILLVDLLISAGFDARVAIGWNGNIGQHAWVVVQVEGEQFVIESTLQESPSMADMIPVKDASPFYRPEQLFDRDRLYFQDATPEKVSSNYFSDSLWKSVSWN